MSKRSKKSRKQKAKAQEKPVAQPFRIPFFSKHPDWVMPSIILLLLLIFFYPVVFGNKTLLPPDALASRSFQPLVDSALNRNIYPLWNPYIFCGMPLFASLTRAPFIDIINTCIIFIIKLISLGNFDPTGRFIIIFINYFLLGIFTYLLFRSKKLNISSAFFCSLAMVFLPQVIAYSAFGHSTKLNSVVLIPLIFLLVDKLLEKRNLLFFCLTGLVMGLQFLRAHTQIAFYTQFMTGVYLIYWLVLTLKDKEKLKVIFQGIGLYMGAVVMGVLLSAVLNLSVLEYSHYSIRGGGVTGGLQYDYATNWSFPPSEIVTFLIPSFMGFGGGTYWGQMPFTDFPLYFGLIVLLLAGLALVINRNRTVWFFTIFAGIVLIVSFGKHFPVLYGPLFKWMPFFNKFRAPKMIHILFQFSMIVLAGYGLQGIFQFHKEKKEDALQNVKRYLLGFGGVFAFLFLILLLVKGLYFEWAVKSQLGPEVAYDKAVSDGLRALLFFGFSAWAIVSALRKKLPPTVLPFIMAGFLIIDFWIVDKNFVEFRPKHNESAYFAETPEVRYLKKQKDEFRILTVQDQRTPNWYAYHQIQNVSGYQGAKVRLYQELIDAFGMPNGFIRKYLKVVNGQYTFKPSSEISQSEWSRDRTFLELTNTRYVVSPYVLPDTSLNLVLAPQKRGTNCVMEVKDYLNRAYFPQTAVTINGKESVLGFMTNEGFDPGRTAVVEKELPGEVIFSNENQVVIDHYDVNNVSLTADVKTSSLLVLSDTYYPAGWQAFVDGKETEIYKTNYAFRSVYLQPGNHKIEFVFRPKMIRYGLYCSVIVFVLLVAGVVFGWRSEKKKRIPLSSN